MSIARTYYDEPTTEGWVAGWHWLHIEASPYHAHLRIGRWTLTITRNDELERDEWLRLSNQEKP